MFKEGEQGNQPVEERPTPPLDWYTGYGRTNTGITGMNYSSVFRQIHDNQLGHHFGLWSHNRPTLMFTKDPDKALQLKKLMDEHAAAVQRLTGFSPEEILEESRRLLKLYSGQSNAPFEVILVEPFENK